MRPPSDREQQFAAAFAFEETEDQLEAITAIHEDLERERPMDRLLCGDVGFGKTEVAMRAAFAAVESGHQVAVLAPTTILADQHLETFRRRFEGFDVRIDMISRFRSPGEIKEIRGRARGRAGRHPDRHAPTAVAGHPAAEAGACSSSTKSSASAWRRRSACAS